jgi:TetR/AcrR family transcriptional repressor of nem operon
LFGVHAKALLMTVDRAAQIMDFTEAEMRRGGPDAVSFRDIAAAIGVKSASVHHHFRTKADLIEAVIARYADRFLEALGAPDDPAETPRDRLSRLIDGYAAAFQGENAGCLCAVLGAVTASLPGGAPAQVRAFFQRLLDWIAAATKGAGHAPAPSVVVSCLQGAMVLALALGEDGPMDDARTYLMAATG